VFGLVGVAGIVAMFVFVDRDSMFLYRGGMALLTLATCGAILSVLNQRGLWSRIMGCTPMCWLGERSYGVDPWHMPAIAFLPGPWLEDHPLLSCTFDRLVTVLLSAMSWKFLEDPIRRNGVVGPVREWLADRREAKAGTPVDTTELVEGRRLRFQ
jgi:Predicted acyltransferases